MSKETDRPFKVVTGSVVVTALGTSFNVNAFESSKKIEVALVSGKVSVENTLHIKEAQAIILNPGEMATLQKRSNLLQKSPFNFQEKIAWKDGIIYFKDANYNEIIDRLELWYGVDITSNKRPENWMFNNTFEKNATLENMLISLQFAYDFQYDIDGKDVQLKF